MRTQVTVLMLALGLLSAGCDDADNPADGQSPADARVDERDGTVQPEDGGVPDADLSPDADLRLRLRGQLRPAGGPLSGPTYRLKGQLQTSPEPGPSAGPTFQVAPGAPLSRQLNTPN